MREILFRGKRVDNGEWVYGSLVNAGVCMIIPQNAEHWGGAEFNIGYIVDPETVGQYTGLADKNGKKIFEGDIAEFDNSQFVVEYFESRMGFGFAGLKGRGVVSGFTMMDWEHLKIIGNIHDNPELCTG